MRNWIAAALAAGMASSALGQVETPRGIGLEIGAYFPTSRVVRDAFGDPILDFGIGGAGTVRPIPGRVRFSPNLVTARKDGNVLFLVGLNAVVDYPLGGNDPYSDSDDAFRPYIRAFGGPAYMDYALDVSATERKARKTIGLNAGIELGAQISERWNVHARYNYFSEQDGLDFSGFSAGVSYLVYRF